MGSYIVSGDVVQYQHGQASGLVPLKEFLSSGFHKDLPANIIVVDVQFRSRPADETENDETDKFSAGLLVQNEKVRKGLCQSLAVSGRLISELYQAFPTGHVHVCVSYAQAVRAFLVCRGVLKEGVLTIVLDDAGERLWMTLLNGMEIFETRTLTAMDEASLMDELRRSIKQWSPRIQGEDNPVWRCWTNNHDFSQELVHSGLCEATDVEWLKDCSFAFEGIKKAQFSAVFLPADEVDKQRRWKARMSSFVFYGCCMALVISAVVAVAALKKQHTSVLLTRDRIKTAQEKVQEVLIQQGQRVYQQALQQQHHPDFERMLYVFVQNKPAAWKVERLSWTRDAHKAESLFDVFLSSAVNGEFGQGEMFQDPQIRHVLFQGLPAQEVSVKMSSEQKYQERTR